jgi:hypothetical protein
MLTKLEFSAQISEKSSNTKFRKNRPKRSQVVSSKQTERRTDGWADGRTSTSKLIVDFRNFEKLPQICSPPPPPHRKQGIFKRMCATFTYKCTTLRYPIDKIQFYKIAVEHFVASLK